ncbi:MAG TPA: efflux RND transporter periplasmic adaptor subunit [Gemmatimonadaceae bacterium]|nr:efflux RND transporter periplasmic adaptor subunit [Gemmatimonadaceae bacterium]
MKRLQWVALSLLVWAGACKPATADDKGAAADQPVVGARTARATEGPFTVTLTAIGTVAARPGRYAELSAPGPTRVARIFVAPGDAVQAGAPLVEFERAPFDAAAASARAALTAAEHNAERATRLAAAGILARKDLDQAQADLAQAQSTEIAANRAQQLATLHAPLAGVVTRMTAVLGAAVDPSQTLVAVADPTALDLAFSLSPSDGALVRPGAAVSVTAGQATRGERLGDGVVTTVGEAVDSVTRAITVRARLARPARTLRIGETIVGRLAVAVHPHAVLVPVQALVPEGDSTKVFVVTQGVAHAQSVSVGGRTETVAEITDGVKVGDEVVTEGAYGMEDSAKVKSIP